MRDLVIEFLKDSKNSHEDNAVVCNAFIGEINKVRNLIFIAERSPSLNPIGDGKCISDEELMLELSNGEEMELGKYTKKVWFFFKKTDLQIFLCDLFKMKIDRALEGIATFSPTLENNTKRYIKEFFTMASEGGTLEDFLFHVRHRLMQIVDIATRELQQLHKDIDFFNTYANKLKVKGVVDFPLIIDKDSK